MTEFLAVLSKKKMFSKLEKPIMLALLDNYSPGSFQFKELNHAEIKIKRSSFTDEKLSVFSWFVDIHKPPSTLEKKTFDSSVKIAIICGLQFQMQQDEPK